MSLKIARHIVAQEWMRSAPTQRLLRILQGSIPADEPQALFVGGCVRNVILGKRVEDIDIATPLLPEDIMEILEKEGVKVIPTGLQHGTITAVCDGEVYEITTLRRDEETDGRHAQVSFTQSWVEDAKRRDFTMNTLLLDGRGNVYDPLGDGLNDIDRKCVRFVGKAKQRIEEDHLRILRFFRFSALYSDAFDAEGLKACEEGAPLIAKLSKERITQEFFKIIASEKPHEVLEVMFTHGVLKDFDFENYNPEFFEHFCMFQTRYTLQALSSRLFVMAALDFENIKAMERYILFPKVFLRDMQAVDGALNLPDLSCDHAVRRAIYRFGRSLTAQALIIELVQDRVMNGYAPKALDIIQNWDIPMFPISGQDLMAKGFAQGPALGAELERLENEWVESDFKTLPDGV